MGETRLWYSLFLRWPAAYLPPLGLPLDIVVHHVALRGVHHREHHQTRYPQQGADARAAKPVVRTTRDHLHVLIRDPGAVTLIAIYYLVRESKISTRGA